MKEMVKVTHLGDEVTLRPRTKLTLEIGKLSDSIELEETIEEASNGQ